MATMTSEGPARSRDDPPEQKGGSGAGTESRAGLKLRRRDDHALVVALVGRWLMRASLPGLDAVEKALKEGSPPPRMAFDASALGEWDSGLVSFVLKCHVLCKRYGIEFAEETLPPGVRKLIRLATAVPEAKDAQHDGDKHSALYRLGDRAIETVAREQSVMTFLGENVLAFFRLLRGKAQLRWSDTWLVIQQCGPEALGVVALINFLVGVILAFVGAVQLRQVGASIFVADLVAIGTVREMGCLMTATILCGRTGAAFAAQLGAMKVNEEIDALRTFGILPIEFLVVPRILALLLMMPLLCIFADAIAITGGYLVSISMLDVTSTEYIRRTIEAITLQSFFLGISKGAFFGVLVAVAGCLRGMQCGTNAAAVGQATTSSVVTGITSIVAADGVFAVLCNALHI